MLLDKLVTQDYDVHSEIDGRWYIAKPTVQEPIHKRIKLAILVLTGKASIFRYAEDMDIEELAAQTAINDE